MTSEIVGNALYLELVANPELSEDEQRGFLGWQSKGVKQLIVFPSVEIEGVIEPPVIMERVVSEYARKAQWDFDHIVRERLKPKTEAEMVELMNNESSYYLSLESYSREEWDALGNTAKQESYAFTLSLKLKNHLAGSRYTYNENGERVEMSGQAWQVRDEKPIAIEFTKDERVSLRSNTTPQAVIRRINKVRGTLDKFPEKLVSFA